MLIAMGRARWGLYVGDGKSRGTGRADGCRTSRGDSSFGKMAGVITENDARVTTWRTTRLQMNR
jgi:hypothetical protein